MTRPWISTLLLCAACSHSAKPAPVAPTASAVPNSAPTCSSVPQAEALPPLASASAAAIISDRGTKLDAYQREGGVWLEHAPVLMNRDFDFALSMSLEGGVGAGLAAAKRREGNTEAAVTLREAQLSPELTKELDALRGCGQHVYFVLWGPADEATLRLVGEVVGGPEAGPTVIEGGKRPLAEWAGASALNEEAGALLERFASPHEGGQQVEGCYLGALLKALRAARQGRRPAPELR